MAVLTSLTLFHDRTLPTVTVTLVLARICRTRRKIAVQALVIRAATKLFLSGCRTSLFHSSRNRLDRGIRCCQVPRPRHTLLSSASELSYLMLLFTVDIIVNIVAETNRFAAQCQADRAVRDPSWYDTTVEEMKAYLGINVMMGIHVLPQLDNYWSSDDYLGVRGIMAVMSRSRFKKITQYFHINDNTTAVARGERGYDPLHKIRPLLSATSNSFARRYSPGRDLSIDEAMVAFKRRSFMKQYMPAKPVKWVQGLDCCGGRHWLCIWLWDLHRKTSSPVPTWPGLRCRDAVDGSVSVSRGRN